MKELRREIYNIVNEETTGVILTPDQPLDEAAPRILEVLQAASDAQETIKKLEKERDELQSEVNDLEDDLEEEKKSRPA